MELKTKYQYTYFIYPYVIKESKYVKYIQRLLKDKNCNLKIFKKDKDFEIYSYFSNRIRNYMFNSFNWNKSKLEKLEELPLETRAAILAKNNCTIFEYNIKKDIQGKTEEKSGIFFKIPKIELICFNTGICFLCIKTNIEDSEKFSDVLNFNYKFRDINQEFSSMNNYDKIRVQTDCFADVKILKEFIKSITGPTIESLKLDIDTERFLTYSYVCIDQESWNNTSEFEKIKETYMKFLNVLPNDNSVNYSRENMKVISKWQYGKLGVTKQGVTMFTSTADINKVVFACDAGLGSSAMGATSFRKRLEKVGIEMDVKNYAIEKVPEDVDVIVTHENLLERAESANPGVRIVTIKNFLKDQNIDDLYDEIVQKNQK